MPPPLKERTPDDDGDDADASPATAHEGREAAEESDSADPRLTGTEAEEEEKEV
jgi:hypothetical protein